MFVITYVTLCCFNWPSGHFVLILMCANPLTHQVLYASKHNNICAEWLHVEWCLHPLDGQYFTAVSLKGAAHSWTGLWEL